MEEHQRHIHIPEKKIRIVFIVSLVLKSFGALSQILLGFMLLVTSGVSEFILNLIQEELIEDPNDFFASHISNAAAHLSPGLQLWGAIYLLSHGIIKAFLVWALLKNKLWAYPTSLAVFSIFIIYQLFHLSRGNWLPLTLFTLFEVFLLALIYHEWRYLLKKRHIPAA